MVFLKFMALIALSIGFIWALVNFSNAWNQILKYLDSLVFKLLEKK